jgi:hypothetical protein
MVDIATQKYDLMMLMIVMIMIMMMISCHVNSTGALVAFQYYIPLTMPPCTILCSEDSYSLHIAFMYVVERLNVWL